MSVREETAEGKRVLVPGKLTTSFGLKRHLKAPKMKLDLVPVLDLIVLALLISLLFTRYLMLPGVRVDLPKTELSIRQDASKVAVLTIANGGMLFFAGSVYEQNSIRQAFQRYFDNSKSTSPVLLVKAEGSMDIQQFLDLCKMAQDSGFGEVQIAADPKAAEQGLTADILSAENNDLVFPVR
ncbi:MAG: biopolymer transport protein ExbD [Lentimonas sp.]|jgi:biopolymer transport protein ExbD